MPELEWKTGSEGAMMIENPSTMPICKDYPIDFVFKVEWALKQPLVDQACALYLSTRFTTYKTST